MSNLMKEKRKEMINEFARDNSDFYSGKKIVYYLMMGIVLSRIIYSVFEISYNVINNSFLGPFSFFIIFFQVLIVFFFMFMIYYSGIRNFSYILLLGGIISLFKTYKDGKFYYFNNGDIFYDIYFVFFIIMLLLQMGGMIFLIFNKKSNVYFSIMKDVLKEMQKMYKPEPKQ